MKNIKWIREGDCIRCISHSLDGHGYAQIRRGGKLFKIARLLLIRRGQARPGIDSMHSCDNRWCINPGHISAGTRGENIRDAASKGRMSIKTPWRVTASHIKTVLGSVMPSRKLASLLGLSHTTVLNIRRNNPLNLRKIKLTKLSQ